MNVLGLARGFPLSLSTGALAFGFNYKLSEWMAEINSARRSKDERRVRVAELRQHNFLLASGAIGLASIPLSCLRLTNAAASMALMGVGWGSAASVVSAVFCEWDNYDDGWKVFVTGSSLFGLIAAAVMSGI